MAAINLSAERARELLDYQPETGLFFWKARPCNSVSIGDVAGTIGKCKYVKIQVDGRLWMAHRLAFLVVTGSCQGGEIDHRNGNPSDNRWDNLRVAGKSINMQNKRSAHRNNSTGFLGVTFDKSRGRYRAQLRVQGNGFHLGWFKTAEDASKSYIEAKRRLHPGCTL